MSKNNVQPNIHPKEYKSYNDGKGVTKQIARIRRRDARKEARKNATQIVENKGA